MSEDRISKLEDALTNLANKFSEFIAIESARQERDKHQIEVNAKMLKHIETFENDHKPIIKRSKKHQNWIDFFVGKLILPLIALAILAAAGFKFYN